MIRSKSSNMYRPMRMLSFPFPIRLPKLLVQTPIPRVLLPPQEDLRIIPVLGDGRCLFRSIVTSLAPPDMLPLSDEKERRWADEMRELAYQRMSSPKAGRYFMRNHIVEGDYDTYLEKMRHPEFHAGEAEIVALSKVLKLPISVYLDSNSSNKNNSNRTRNSDNLTSIATYGEKYKFKDKHIRVLYNAINHYDAVRVVKKTKHDYTFQS